MAPPWLGELHTVQTFRRGSEPYLDSVYLTLAGFRRAGPRNGRSPGDRHWCRQTDRSSAEEGETFGLQEPHQQKRLG